ncbi:acyltransferase [Curtobacterium flaccumfaciens pv. flaccumfaciens]|uniref:acyltransferase family protein n=1 Tax=Curtobacterium flaccumfaciens TaxID=2035 RepID=UPI001BDF5061|nr:acyltransferase family protein [Curtobacterium flaccumfaciens]MBT1670961.1 acyltransferase [Curtobacterium flaccumfaciens pv. flaccumfaciens]
MTVAPARAARHAPVARHRARHNARRASGAADTRTLRLEIQAVRAIAIGAVVLYHLFPEVLPGGYVGVDVFFVISGFLITAHIAKPLATGRFSFRAFYARRAWRLLPASMATLFVTVILTAVFVPRTLWKDFTEQIIASALYVENWALAGNAVDYSALASDASIVQHFWSLSTEEQFYAVWPLVLWFCAFVRYRRRRRNGVSLAPAIAVALGIVFVLSLAYSIWATAHTPASYFLTTTRAWEFAAGGLLWLGLQRVRIPAALAAAMSWTGLVLVATTALRFDASTPFPSWTALIPIIGVSLVIAGGMPEPAWSPAFLYRLRPVQWLGDVSYSLYLWHWPLLIVMPFVIGTPTGEATPLWAKGIVLVVALVLAHFSRRLIEQPVIAFSSERMRARHPRHRGVLVLAIAGMLVVAVPAASMYWSVVREETAGAATGVTVTADGTLTSRACHGAAAMQPGADCAQVDAADITPSPVQAGSDAFADQSGAGCQVAGDDTTVRGCEVGDPDGTVRLAIVGDSHAANYVPSLELIAKAKHWSLTTYLHSGCPMTRALVTPSCNTWKADTLERLQQERYDVVFVAAMSRTPWPHGIIRHADEMTPQVRDDAAGQYAKTWVRLQQAGSSIVALRDNPDPGIGGVSDVPSCVEQHGDGAACDVSEADALIDDPVAQAARTTPGVTLIDSTAMFCADGTCPSVIGGVVVYRQVQHVTQTYARSMAPFLEPKVTAAVEAAVAG